MEIARADTGLGTAFERLSLNRYFASLLKRHSISSVLEGPTDGIKGIMGINSMELSRLGAHVTLILESQPHLDYASSVWKKYGCEGTFICQEQMNLDVPPQSFDMVWNFSALPQIENYEATIDAMVKASRKYVLVFVSNTRNYGFRLHRLHHEREKEPWHHGNIDIMDVGKIGGLLRARGLEVVEEIFADVPWWPDIDKPVGELISTFLPFLKAFVKDTAHARRFNFDIENLPYYDPSRQKDMDELYRRHGVFERSGIKPLQHFFAHHRGVLAQKS